MSSFSLGWLKRDEKTDSSRFSHAWTGCHTCPGVKPAAVIRCESAWPMGDATCGQSRSAEAGVGGGVEGGVDR